MLRPIFSDLYDRIKMSSRSSSRSKDALIYQHNLSELVKGSDDEKSSDRKGFEHMTEEIA